VSASNNRKTLATGIITITSVGLIDLLAQSATFVRARAQDFVLTDPPPQVAQIILERIGRWKFPTLAGIITTPAMRPDGSILPTAGYDPGTCLYYEPDLHLRMPPISERPTRQDAEAALDLLSGLLQNFPFVTEAGDRARSVVPTFLRNSLQRIDAAQPRFELVTGELIDRLREAFRNASLAIGLGLFVMPFSGDMGLRQGGKGQASGSNERNYWNNKIGMAVTDGTSGLDSFGGIPIPNGTGPNGYTAA
jgi:hypothetical protein